METILWIIIVIIILWILSKVSFKKVGEPAKKKKCLVVPPQRNVAQPPVPRSNLMAQSDVDTTDTVGDVVADGTNFRGPPEGLGGQSIRARQMKYLR